VTVRESVTVLMMTAPHAPSRQLYLAWVEDQIEEYKSSLSRDELMTVADEAVQQLFDSPDDQIPLTELLLRDAVDTLLFRRLKLPTYKQWLKERSK
jgi:hypothetical protein